MAFRKKVSRGKAEKVFRKTASKTLKVNNTPPASRGGIRL